MSRKTFIAFGLTVLVLAVLIPWLAFRADGEPPEAAAVPAGVGEAKSLFQTNCGTCHVLAAAGTSGNFGPDLDDLLAPTGPPTGSGAEDTIEKTEGRVLNAILKGVNSSTTPGRMPGGILSGEQAEEVAAYVAHVAGAG